MRSRIYHLVSTDGNISFLITDDFALAEWYMGHPARELMMLVTDPLQDDAVELIIKTKEEAEAYRTSLERAAAWRPDKHEYLL
jgi:hypothetical protein